MNHRGRALAPKEFGEGGFVANVSAGELEQRIACERSQQLPPAAVQVVDANDGNLALQQLFDNVRAEKSGGAGNHPRGTHLVRVQRLASESKIRNVERGGLPFSKGKTSSGLSQQLLMKAVQNPDLIRHGEGSLRTQSSVQTASILSNMRTK